MTVFDRRPRLRWTVPLAAGAVVVGVVVAAGAATADGGLPARTPAELLVALQQPSATAVSGTVEVTTDLGLPALPGVGGDAGPSALLTGTHTVRVWSDGTDSARIDLLGASDEFDVIRAGADVWTWSSATSEATHYTLPAKDLESAAASAPAPELDATGMPSTPQEAADLVLAALDPTTAVTTTGTAVVAGRPVYELVLTPTQDGTRVAKAVLAVDAQTSVPLSVRVYSTQSATPAIDVSFTSVDFTAPDPGVFAFTPPAGATVTEGTVPSGMRAGAGKTAPGDAPTVVGRGWTAVAVLPAHGADLPTSSEGSADQLDGMLALLPRVSGPWGSGRILDGALVSVLLADDGRMAVGAVTPQVLEAALTAA